MKVRVWLLFLGLIGPALCQVRVWQDNQILSTYEEGPPDPWPPFYAFTPTQASVYPYTMRNGFTKKRGEHAWRMLHLENEYLSCMVLPDLGGHLYSCKDKLSGQEMFHLNPTVKKASIGLRGAWVAMGIEMNFPTGHSWVTVSPVDFATLQNADGSASIWVGNIDRVDGMQWRVEFVLRPGVAVLQQNVFLYNRSDVRHRYYWWNTAGIARVDNKTRFIFPTQMVSSHGRTEIETWPVTSAGIDVSVIGNYKGGGVAWFAQDCREPFMAVYHPTLRSGTAHYAEVADVPGKKLWSWGREGDKTAAVDLSDDNTSYLEMQAGVMENQETYAFLEPGEYKKFSEYWMPVRGLGGVSRANREGVLNFARSSEKNGQTQLLVEFNANRKVAGGKIVVTDWKSNLLEESVSFDPSSTFSRTVKDAPAQATYTVQVLDSAGQVLLTHTEGRYEASPPRDVTLGPQPERDRSEKSAHSAADFLEIGAYQELQGMPGLARHAYQSGLAQFPEDRELTRAMGRLAVSESRFDEAVSTLSEAPDDSENHYYLGLAYFRFGVNDRARQEFEKVGAGQPLYYAALLRRATLLGRSNDYEGALKLLETVLTKQPDSVEAGAMEVMLLRRSGKTEKARSELARWRLLDATDSRLRYERVLLGDDDAALWAHLAGDPDRVLDVATAYMDLGLYDDALTLLSRQFPTPPDTLAAEPGAVLPQHHPLVAYYRAYCLSQLRRPARKDFDEASGYLTEYIFPNRPLTYAVLNAAIRENPNDGTALFLLGELYLSSELVEKAVDTWQQSLRVGFKKVEIYRVLGRALLDLKQDRQGALAVYQQGLKIAPNDPVLQKGVEGLFGSEARVASVSGAPVVKTPASPAQAAAEALGMAAEGKVIEAMAAFDPAIFTAEKQENGVREAYIEIKVEQVLALARAKRCTEAFDAEEKLGDEVPDLPFTFRGFGQFLKGTRIQFELASMEAMCGNNGGAKKTWTKIAKALKEVSDPDFALPLVSAAKIAPEAETKPRIETALEQIKTALAVSGGNRATLLYSRGMLLRAVRLEKEALAAFAEAIGADPPPMVAYLSIKALRGR